MSWHGTRHVIAPDCLDHQVNETLDGIDRAHTLRSPDVRGNQVQSHTLRGRHKAQQLQQLVAGRCSGLEIKWLVRDCL